LAASAAALLLLTLPLSACGGPSSNGEGKDTFEIVTIPPISVPDQPDERTFTDLTTYTDKLKELFSVATPAPEGDFTYETTESGVTVTGYTGGDVVVVIPDTVDGKPVTAIGEGAFADRVSLKGISIPDSVTSIGKGAFKGCKSLSSLRTPVFTCEGAPYFGALFGAQTHEANGSAVPLNLKNLVLTAGEQIPDYAFYACRGLQIVSLPETLTQIGDYAFYACDSLAYITMGETSLKTVGWGAFIGCESLLELRFPATVETLGFAMLEGCRNLENLVLPFVGGSRVKEEAEQNTAHVGFLFGASDYAHTQGFIPASLISVTILEGGGDIPANAFFECWSVREINLPSDATAIGRRAFYGCEGLAVMTLPDSVTSVGADAFRGCVRLTSFAGGKELTTLGFQAFMDCVSLHTVTLPDTVAHLPNSCFAGCISLVSLTADGVQTQGEQVFRHCGRLGLPWVSPECVPSETEKKS